jgi:hypothetical protein
MARSDSNGSLRRSWSPTSSDTAGSPPPTKNGPLRVSALRSDLINPSIALHHDRILKRTGDGMREHLNGSKAADSGPSRGDCCRPAIRPKALEERWVPVDPLLPFKNGPMSGREARESGLRLKAQVFRSYSEQRPRPRSFHTNITPRLWRTNILPAHLGPLFCPRPTTAVLEEDRYVLGIKR